MSPLSDLVNLRQRFNIWSLVQVQGKMSARVYVIVKFQFTNIQHTQCGHLLTD